jgi:hypothetical protein
VGRQLHRFLQHDLLPVKMRSNRLHAVHTTPICTCTQAEEKACIEQRSPDLNANSEAFGPWEEAGILLMTPFNGELPGLAPTLPAQPSNSTSESSLAMYQGPGQWWLAVFSGLHQLVADLHSARVVSGAQYLDDSH